MRSNALGCEQHLLRLVRPHVAKVPATIAAGFLPSRRPWVAQERVPGVPLSLALSRLADGEQQRIWREVGRLLRHLRQIPAPWFGTPDGRERFSDWPSMVAHDAAGLLNDARRMGLSPEPFAALNGGIQRHHAELFAVRRPSVVHSDLVGPRHIFVDCGDEGCAITGVIDWEYGRYADPDSEGMLIQMIDRSEDDPARIAFLDGYGPFDASPSAAVRRRIYRGIAFGWEVTDAHRCRDLSRYLKTTSLFNRWSLEMF